MGIIFDRLRRLATVTANSMQGRLDAAQRVIDLDDDELRRIIDELNGVADVPPRPSSERRQAPPRTPPPPSVPKHVQQAAAILGVPADGSAAAIKSAWRRKIAATHPDRFANHSAAEQDRARTETQALNTAYAILKQYRGFA